MADEPFALTIPAPPATDAEYDTICAAVMETGRGRWFLTEYARRNRHADTQVLLTAIERIEAAIRNEPAVSENAVELPAESPRPVTGARIAVPEADDDDGKGTPPKNIADALENAAASIRSAIERLQDISWKLRERQYDDKFCDEIEARTSEIARACVVLDVAAAAAHDIASFASADGHRAEATAEAATPDVSAASTPTTPVEPVELLWNIDGAAPDATSVAEEPIGGHATNVWDQSAMARAFETEATPVMSLWELPDSMEPPAGEPAIEPTVDAAIAVTQAPSAEGQAVAAPVGPTGSSEDIAPQIARYEPAPPPRNARVQTIAPDPELLPRTGWLSDLLLTRIARGEDEDSDRKEKVTAVATQAEALLPAAAPAPAEPAEAVVEPEPIAIISEPAPQTRVEVVSVAADELDVIAIDAPQPVVETPMIFAVAEPPPVPTPDAAVHVAEAGIEDDPADFLLEPLPATLTIGFSAPAPRVIAEAAAPKPPHDPLAPIRQMSEEEKIALVS